jgi:hypothetical protein
VRRAQLREEVPIHISAKRAAETATEGNQRRQPNARLKRHLPNARQNWSTKHSGSLLGVTGGPSGAQLWLQKGPLNLLLAPRLKKVMVAVADPTGPPLIEPIKRGHSSPRVHISAEELALIVAFCMALDAKERINWQAYWGLRDFDRLRLEAIINLAELVEEDSLKAVCCCRPRISAFPNCLCPPRKGSA